MDQNLAFFIEKFLEVGKPAPSCSAEDCVLQWVIYQTQIAQSIYDTAGDANLSPEDFSKVQDLYKHMLQEILESGLRSLGALEV